MQIADGRKTVEEVRASGAERKAEHDERKKISPLRNGEPETDLADEISASDSKPIPVPIPPADIETSWLVEAIDDDGKHWTSGVRLGSKKEASEYLVNYAGHDLRKQTLLMELRVVASDDKPNLCITFGKTGHPTLLFEHGECGLMEWRQDDGLDIPACLRRTA
jgi:hypothetical protein